RRPAGERVAPAQHPRNARGPARRPGSATRLRRPQNRRPADRARRRGTPVRRTDHPADPRGGRRRPGALAVPVAARLPRRRRDAAVRMARPAPRDAGPHPAGGGAPSRGGRGPRRLRGPGAPHAVVPPGRGRHARRLPQQRSRRHGPPHRILNRSPGRASRPPHRPPGARPGRHMVLWVRLRRRCGGRTGHGSTRLGPRTGGPSGTCVGRLSGLRTGGPSSKALAGRSDEGALAGRSHPCAGRAVRTQTGGAVRHLRFGGRSHMAGVRHVCRASRPVRTPAGLSATRAGGRSGMCVGRAVRLLRRAGRLAGALAGGPASALVGLSRTRVGSTVSRAHRRAGRWSSVWEEGGTGGARVPSAGRPPGPAAGRGGGLRCVCASGRTEVGVRRRGWVLFALMGVLWGIPYLMIKVAVDSVSVPMVVFSRTALGAAVLLPLAIRAGQLDAVRRHWRPLLAFTAMEILGPWALLSHAETELTSSMTGLLIAAVPIISVVLARLTGDAERLGPLRWAGLLVGLTGVFVLAWPHLGGGSAWAIGEAMLVAIGYSIAPMIALRRLQGLPSLHMAAFSLAIAAVVYAGPAAVTRPDTLPSGRVLAALAGLGLVCTAFAFIVFFELIREVGT